MHYSFPFIACLRRLDVKVLVKCSQLRGIFCGYYFKIFAYTPLANVWMNRLISSYILYISYVFLYVFNCCPFKFMVYHISDKSYFTGLILFSTTVLP